MGFWKGWCGARDGGAAIPPVVARILSGDSTSPLTREASVVVRTNFSLPEILKRAWKL
ncbi:MAG: hypothetical protein ACLSAQ_12120 [[Eubacterium] siraeum]